MRSERERLTRRQVEGAPFLWSLLSLSRPPFSNARDDELDRSPRAPRKGAHLLAPRVVGGPEDFVGIIHASARYSPAGRVILRTCG